MRAGSLSDPRIVALLTEHFVCARIPELCTKSLIPDRRDVELLERLHADAMQLSVPGRVGFLGGEREAFLSPDGELLDVFLTLGTQGHEDSQFQHVQRRKPEAAVQMFFRQAAAALRTVTGGLPADFEALRDGTAPAVEQARRALRPQGKVPAGQTVLRVSVRNDRLMYSALVGDELWLLAKEQARALLPGTLAAGSTSRWPDSSFLALAHQTYPRGHVAPQLDDESITGGITTRITTADGDLVRGTFTGALGQEPSRPGELGMRDNARVSWKLSATLRGDFEFDRARGEFTRLRLASVASELEHTRFSRPEYPKEGYWLGVELVNRGRTP